MKPLGQKAYGSIPHLPGSRMGPADHHCHEGQAAIATEKLRDGHDRVVVQEKLDGSCVAVAKIDREIVALGRSGYLATTSPYEQHHIFAAWVQDNRDRFGELLLDGERVVGEWLAMAHGTLYDLTDREPFVAFDLIFGGERATVYQANLRLTTLGFSVPHVISDGPPLSVAAAIAALGPSGFYGALDTPEGAVWRVERDNKVDFLVKYVRPDKVDGKYFANVTGSVDVWNWRPTAEAVAA